MSTRRYKAFISYSHRDRAWSAWLQRALERYRIPKRLVGTPGAFGPIPARLAPVFRDREDLSSAADLSTEVKASLEASESLVVICSPAAAKSRWVDEEVRHFISLGRGNRIFALIVEGDPQADDLEQRCFPPSLTRNADGTSREPLAADARKWADGKLLAKLKIVAGILGIGLDDLRRRDMQRRHRMWMLSMGGALSIALAMAVLAVMAISARHAAENRREHAEELVGYMVGDLKSKLDEVGRLDILEGMGGRVSEYLQTLDPAEVTDDSLIQQARVWRQLGEVGMNQGDLPAALEAFMTSRDILLELHRRNPATAQFVYELGNAEFWVGYVHLETGRYDEAEKALNDYLGWAYRLNALEPGKPEWLIEKSYAHNNLAALINRRGANDVDSALVHIRHAVEYNRQAVTLAPDNATYLVEYAEVMAWLADTLLRTCDLGGALTARQEQVAITRQLSESAPGNSSYNSRYAYALTGFADVASQVGLTEVALTHLTTARDRLRRLSASDPSNVDLRFDYLLREFYIAELLAESGHLDKGLQRIHEIADEMGAILRAEEYSHQLRHYRWVRYLLARSDMAWRSGDPVAAAADLDEAVAQLRDILRSNSGDFPDQEALSRARFQLWEQQGVDLFAEQLFATVAAASADNQSCATRADRVRHAILTGEKDVARRLVTSLLGKGYYEPGFMRVCTEHGFCQGK
jgi:tetratricopeptide (TPR) repeat protein